MNTTQGLFGATAIRQALVASLVKLDPRVQWHNPVMLVVEIGAVVTTTHGGDARARDPCGRDRICLARRPHALGKRGRARRELTRRPVCTS